jgi:hypothetical protein
MWCNGTLDSRLNVSPPRDFPQPAQTIKLILMQYFPNRGRYRRRTRIVQQLPRYSNSREENVSIDRREAIAMVPRDLVMDGRVYAEVVRPGEVVMREASGHMWRTTEEAWVRELRLQERMREAGLM